MGEVWAGFCFIFSLFNYVRVISSFKIACITWNTGIYYFLLFFNKPIYAKEPKVVRLRSHCS